MPLPYNPRLKVYARELRNNSTVAEVLLWNHLKRGKRLGYDFHRQKPILEWIADFYCAQLNLVIEIDGDSHRVKATSDRAKEDGFRKLGLTVLRFGDTQVKENPPGVAQLIDRWIEEQRPLAANAQIHTPPCGHPSREGTSAATTGGEFGRSRNTLEPAQWTLHTAPTEVPRTPPGTVSDSAPHAGRSAHPGV